MDFQGERKGGGEKGRVGEAPKNQEAGYSGYRGWEALVTTRLLVTNQNIVTLEPMSKYNIGEEGRKRLINNYY